MGALPKVLIRESNTNLERQLDHTECTAAGWRWFCKSKNTAMGATEKNNRENYGFITLVSLIIFAAGLCET